MPFPFLMHMPSQADLSMKVLSGATNQGYNLGPTNSNMARIHWRINENSCRRHGITSNGRP